LVERLIWELNYSWNIEINNFSNSFLKHYWISRNIIENLINNKDTIGWYYKYYDVNWKIKQESIYKLHNIRWNYTALSTKDKDYIDWNKNSTTFILNFNKDTWTDFYEPLSACWYHSTFQQYWYNSQSWNFTDHWIVYFSVYDWCTYDNYNQWATVKNGSYTKPYITNSWKYQELYLKF